MSYWEDSPGWTQDTLERFSLLAGLRSPQCPPGELEEVAGDREFWAFLSRLHRWMDSFLPSLATLSSRSYIL